MTRNLCCRIEKMMVAFGAAGEAKIGAGQLYAMCSASLGT
jgi:hypothetical protein